MPDSQRVLVTKEKIKDAFLSLCASKKLEKISIREITDLAGVNRGTFYAYFLDIYDIKEQTEEDFFNMMREKAGIIVDAILEGRPVQPHLPDTKFYLEQKKYFDVILNENVDGRMIRRIKETAHGFIRKKLGEQYFGGNQTMDYIMEYMLGAHMAVLTSWLRQGMPIPLESLMALLKDISTTGPATILKKQMEEMDAGI